MRLGRFRRQPVALRPGPTPEDGEHEEARLGRALLAGDVPPVWYRQRITALAGDRARLERDDAADLPNDVRGWDV